MNAVADVAPRAGLRGRILKAGSWVIAGQLTAQFIRFATNVVLSRLLFPDAFGLMSVASLLITALGLFSDIGIARSIVQTKRTDAAMLNTAWTLQVIRGQFVAGSCIIAAFAFAAASHFGISKAGTVYADSRLPWLVGVFALSPAISAFDSIRNGLARREMQLHTLIKLDIAAQVASALVMAVFGWATRSFWTLVVGAVTSVLVRCISGHLVLKGHREGFQIDRGALRELMSHGKWIFVSSILTFVGVNGDRMFLGGLIDASQFGLYVIALLIGSVPLTLASSLCNSIVYPALSEVWRERPHALASVLGRFQAGYDVVITTLFAIMVTAGPALVELIYDARYRGAGWMMSILSAGMIGYRYQVVEQSYQAVGKPKYLTFANFLRLAALISGILIGQRLGGMRGIITGIALSYYAGWPLAIWFKVKYKVLSWRTDFLFVPAIAIGLGAGWLLSLGLHAMFPARVH